MKDIEPFETWFDNAVGEGIHLPDGLARMCGELRIPVHEGRAHVISNFVETMDGIVTLAVPGQEGGGDISGFNRHDRLLMGILRAAADVVIISSSSLEVNPGALWTAEDINPDWADEYRKLRELGRMPAMPPHIVVTGSGELNPQARLFHTPGLEVLILTTRQGAERVSDLRGSSAIRVKRVRDGGPLPAREILDAVQQVYGAKLVLTEAGPHLTAYFIEENALDELFLTVSPQVAGREALSKRLGFNAGKEFAPGNPRWARLVSARRAGDHLFLRYGFGGQ